MAGTKLTDISSIIAPLMMGAGSLLVSASDNDPLTLRGHDVLIDGHTSGFDFWVGDNVSHCYFGGNPDGGMPAPIPSTLGYFARESGGLAHILDDAWTSTAASPNGANFLLLRRFRGTPASPSAVQSTDYLGTIG